MTTHPPTLAGLRLLNTRPKDQANRLSQAIRRAGGVAIELPTIAIHPTPTAWLLQLPDLTTLKQALFMSPNAVHYFFTTLHKAKRNWPSTIQVTAIGQGTARALRSRHITVHHTPKIADSEHVLALDNLQHIQQQPILLITGEGGRELISNALRSRGAALHPILVYRRSLPEKNEEYINSLWHNDHVDIILFTSQQAMHHLFILFCDQARPWIISKPCVVISPRLAEAASVLGLKTIIVSRYDDVLTTLEGFNHAKKHCENIHTF